MMSMVECKQVWRSAKATWFELARDEAGQDLIEYALAGCLVGLAAIASVKSYGVKLASVLGQISTSMNAAI